ncbi:hypothetical protein [Corynebacterium sp. 13CS0277]|uniref:hypothetical protein n=1 Tax=Corynebacterium sp. 13CS0277 TaxID=2071994 RepID=UPI0011B1C643|nr:hypothetical protein [Corynebacterium sp. 13CS0277]
MNPRALLYRKTTVVAVDAAVTLAVALLLVASGLRFSAIAVLVGVAAIIFHWQVLSEQQRSSAARERFERFAVARLNYLDQLGQMPRKLESVILEQQRQGEKLDNGIVGVATNVPTGPAPSHDPAALSATASKSGHRPFAPGRHAADAGHGTDEIAALQHWLVQETGPQKIAVLAGSALANLAEEAGTGPGIEVQEITPYTPITNLDPGTSFILIDDTALVKDPWMVITDATGTRQLRDLCVLVDKAAQRGIATAIIGPLRAGHHIGALREAAAIIYDGHTDHAKFGEAVPSIVARAWALHTPAHAPLPDAGNQALQ